MTMTNTRNDTWGDVNAQLDYFTNAGLSIDSIYNSALTTNKLLSISPIKSTTSNKETSTTWYLATDKVEHPRDCCEEDLSCSDIASLPPLLPSTPRKSSLLVDKQSQERMNVCIDKAALLAKRRSKLQEEVQDMNVCIDKVALFSNRRSRSKAKHQISALQRQALKHYKKRKAKHTTTTKKLSNKGIKSPTANDILRGRGPKINKHEGNMKLRDEARKLRDDYQDGYYGSSKKEVSILT